MRRSPLGFLLLLFPLLTDKKGPGLPFPGSLPLKIGHVASSLSLLSDSHGDSLTTFSSHQDPALAQSPDVRWMGTGTLRASQIWPPASPLRSSSTLGDHLEPPYEIGVCDFLAGQSGTRHLALRPQPYATHPRLVLSFHHLSSHENPFLSWPFALCPFCLL